MPSDHANVRTHNVCALAELTMFTSEIDGEMGCIPHAANGQTTVTPIAISANTTQPNRMIMGAHSQHAMHAAGDQQHPPGMRMRQRDRP